MSNYLVNQYHIELERIKQNGGSLQEKSIRFAFQKLLSEYSKTREFQLIPELGYQTRTGRIVYPNGTVKDVLRLDWGYWESKEQYDDLDQEIENKLSQGYPDSNILFEDSQIAILIQGGTEVMRVPMQDREALDRILTHFINYVHPEVRDFRVAIEIFKQDLPTILDTLRDMINRQYETNAEFNRQINEFWEISKESINPELTVIDIREMMIQHILTEDIFITIFNEFQFHKANNIARELQRVIDTFFTSSNRKNILSTIERYYGAIRRTAANIYDHHEKQKFLKAVYENFYKAYNPQAADRLGIVYTPNEIVRFMIESVDYLVHQHFGKLLSNKNVEILDPATGTGTFITELIEYLPKNRLKHKYKNEIHCNEVAILPYYVANLNIEFTYKQKMGKYEEFENICFVDTLEHTYFEGKQGNLFALSVENTERIKRQNDRTISVIIGNPPYHANQFNGNDNKNIKYSTIDRRIKNTYIRSSKAQKTKLYDMYARFLRWASDRLGENGVIAFVSNNSFIDARTYDGFRKVIAEEFNEIYIINLKGNARTSGERRRREGGNVFNNKIRVGIAVYFLVRNRNTQGCRIYYNAVDNYVSADEKKSYLSSIEFQNLQFERIVPDEDNNWIDLTNNNFDSLLNLANKYTKLAKSRVDERAVFKLFSLGVITARDEWVYAESVENLEQKVRYLIDVYNQDVDNYKNRILSGYQFPIPNTSIKWTRAVKNDLIKGKRYTFVASCIRNSLYRPFIKQKLYFSKNLNEIQYQLRQIFPDSNQQNLIISFTAPGSLKPFMALASDRIPDYHLIGDSQCLPLYCYNKDGNRIDNITDWGLEQFHNYYNDSKITKLDIFHYTYAVLHNPAYRRKYELNLKREFPRLPFYDDFHQWVSWGQQLINLHINYETVEPYPLRRIDLPLDQDNKAEFNDISRLPANVQVYPPTPKVKLKADKDRGRIIVDTVTTLEDIPEIAWEYRLGSHCALEWILEHYKEKKPKDPTIAERFNTYRFVDYKEQVVELLQRVCTVSVETMRIIREMED